MSRSTRQLLRVVLTSMTIGVSWLALIGLILGCSSAAAGAQPRPAPDEWTAYGRDAGGMRFSPLTQITRQNVESLQVAWVHRTGDVLAHRGRFAATPLMVDGTLFLATPIGRVIALDPATGVERWSHDTRVDLAGDYGDFTNRGVSTWVDSRLAPNAACRRRIIYASIDARLFALDARTGRRCAGFGDSGFVDLAKGVRNQPAYKGEYQVTSPPAIIGDLAVVGSAIADNYRMDGPSGVVRAFDIRTGAVKWSWDPVPGDPKARGHDTWKGPKAHTTGAANAWSIISADPELGLVYVPTGSASPDYYGGERLGQNLYSNSVVALRATTGEVVWHFQVVHHDLWDYDVAAQPVLFTLRRDGRAVRALAQATKMGHLFILNRETGAPLFPVEERSVAKSAIEGEEAWPTQPFPTKPAPLVPSRLTMSDVWGATEEERAACRARAANLTFGDVFTPPSLAGTIVYPGNIGGSHWGAVAIDTSRGILVTPTNRLAWVVRLVPRDEVAGLRGQGVQGEFAAQRGTPYAMIRDPFMSPRGLPCTPPPWGALTAIDLATGDVKWERPFGTMPQATSMPGHEQWGAINLGGVMTTASGLVFAAGTVDPKLRAFDVETGRELWAGMLPTSAHSLPMTYRARDGRQYVVVASGGHDRLGNELGDHLVAYRLPRASDPAPRATPVTLASHYEGEIRAARLRIETRMEIRARGDSLVGSIRTVAPGITGTLRGTRRGHILSLVIDFRFPAESCDGTLRGNVELANRGTLMVGRLAQTGCTQRRDEAVTVSLRPR